jgi:polysaccharide export outer membrane protein
MRLRFSALSFIPLFILAVGCRSYGPQFNPHAQSGSKTNQFVSAQRLTDQSFATVETTNRVPADWLTAPTNFFKLGPGDILDVEVIGNTASKATASVGPDGKIYYSLLPGLFVWGLTLTEAKDAFEKSFAKYFRDSQEVSLNLRAVGSKRVWILGNVHKPGVYPLAVPLTLLEAISSAGGAMNIHAPSMDAVDLQNSFVMRDGKLLPVDFYRLLRSGDLSQNIYLQPDDFIYVRSLPSADVYVLGAVGGPTTVPFSEDLSVAAVIAQAGGTIKYGQATQVAVVRGSLSQPKIAIVNYREIRSGKALDVLLQPGDIVYVPFSPFKKLGQLAEQLVNDFVSSVAVNAGTHAVEPNAGAVVPSIGISTPAK